MFGKMKRENSQKIKKKKRIKFNDIGTEKKKKKTQQTRPSVHGALPFFFFTKLSPFFPKDGPHDAGPKNSADTSVA
jgi:hypothetical protein